MPKIISDVSTSKTNEIENADQYILPGVGSFDDGIKSLKNANFFKSLEKQVLKNKKPILGICLGMQLLTNSSEEGEEEGLGWIDATTVKFKTNIKKLAIPHMGWNIIDPVQTDDVFKNLNDSRFYFVHSYYVVCKNEKNIIARTNYHQNFTSIIRKNNILGVQFHPEKSHQFGLKFFQNFSNFYG